MLLSSDRQIRAVLPFVIVVTLAGCLGHASTSRSTPSAAVESVFSFKNGLTGVHAASPSVKLAIGTDAALGDTAVLLVEYPEASNDPASRDVRLDAEHRDWSRGKALSFLVKPATSIRMSVSFVDRNGVAYTSWSNLQADVWQMVRIEFTAIRPNPYFQPPGARLEAPINLTRVDAVGFAPQDRLAGKLAIGQILLMK